MAVACDDGSIKIFGVENGKDMVLRSTLMSDSGRALSVSWEKGGNRLATGHSDGSIRIWDLTVTDNGITGIVGWTGCTLLARRFMDAHSLHCFL